MSWSGKLAGLFSFRRISGQIAALILITLVLIHVLMAGYFLLRRQEPRLLTDEPVQQFVLIARIVSRTPAAERPLLVSNIGRGLPNLQLRLIEDAASAAARLTAATPIVIRTLFEGQIELVRGSASEAESVLFHLADGGLLEATVGKPHMPPFFTGLWISTLLFLIMSVTLLGVWAGRALRAPLSAFARAAESFNVDRISPPFPESGPEEIRSAARALNAMQDRIAALMRDRTRMLAAISHDLRTPITRLRLRSEFIADEAHRTQTLRDLDQMQSMLESVLTLLRSGNAVTPTLVDVAALVQLVCEQFSDCGHAVRYDGPKRCKLTVRPDEIRRAVTNLVENAVRFASEVTVTLTETDKAATIEIADNGPGIPEHSKSAMLEPFVRGDEARTMDESSGFGLGLSIAQAVVQAHDGEFSLHDNAPQGLRVSIRLPRAHPA
ncbi:ATP-binding protein [Bradyrhizobium sp. CCBAU 51753]|uniref:ATP-binding protein n=1 Tax=Bradyrhizobium sp. CCBAU 51753 TaxID=1325100 RepID=UPI00188A0764|nr:ATP-binding protein [Bradyrhizobium sp. CCBAU 51753]QOZ24457.1 two-component sensor histidine kinase [Bradyrhizobium sp. CCBAU 51753]